MFLSLLIIIACLFLLVATIIVLFQWNKIGKRPKGILSVLLFFFGILSIRHLCSMPHRVDVSVDLLFLLIMGVIPILVASLIASKLLCSTLKTTKKNIFIAVLLIILLFLSFTGGHSSLYSLINRISQNGIVSDTEIVLKESIQDGVTPERAIEIADNYLRSPNEANTTYYWDIIENRHKKATGTYIWDMYGDYWMKKVVVSTVSWTHINNSADIRWKLLSPINNVAYKNKNLYRVSFHFNSILHNEDNVLIVYIDQNGNVVGTMSYILE